MKYDREVEDYSGKVAHVILKSITSYLHKNYQRLDYLFQQVFWFDFLGILDPQRVTDVHGFSSRGTDQLSIMSVKTQV